MLVCALQAQDRLQALAKALALRQNAVEEQEAQLLQRQDVLEVKAVASQDHDNYIKELSEQTQQKAGALSVQEQELNQLDQTLKKRESRLVAQVQRLDAQIQREEHEEVCILHDSANACLCECTVCRDLQQRALQCNAAVVCCLSRGGHADWVWSAGAAGRNSGQHS